MTVLKHSVKVAFDPANPQHRLLVVDFVGGLPSKITGFKNPRPGTPLSVALQAELLYWYIENDQEVTGD